METDVVHQDRTGELASPKQVYIYEGRVARIHPDGDPLRYIDRVEYRDEAGLKEILDELQSSKPFTLLHPNNLISAGAKADIIGQVIGARIDGTHVIAQILVTAQRAIDAIKSGVHELSLGYTSRLDANQRQRGIKIDHLALIPKARCGPTCTLRADCVGAESCPCNNHTISYNQERMGDQIANIDEDADQVRSAMARFSETEYPDDAARRAAFRRIVARARELGVDTKAFENKYGEKTDHKDHVMDELQKQLTAALTEAATLRAKADSLDGQLKDANAKITKLEVDLTNTQADLKLAKADAEKVKADAETAVSQAKLDADKSLGEAVKTRVDLLTTANRILGDKDDKGQAISRLDMSDLDLRLAVIKHVDGEDLPEDKRTNTAFVEGVYHGAVRRADSVAKSRQETREAVRTNQMDGVKNAKDAAKGKAMSAEQRERMAMLNMMKGRN